MTEAGRLAGQPLATVCAFLRALGHFYSGDCMKRLLLGISIVGAAFATSAVPAAATVNDQGTITTFETIGPNVVAGDNPCDEGEQYLETGTKATRFHFVDAEEGLHVFFSEHNEGTAVPVDGTGPTYVERGNTDHQVFNANLVNGVFVFNHVNNDSFVAYRDGKLDASSTIRIQEHEHYVLIDTDGDGVPDVVRAEFSKNRFTFSCP
jgi:hypothetical protein